jgi:hypothetical protein
MVEDFNLAGLDDSEFIIAEKEDIQDQKNGMQLGSEERKALSRRRLERNKPEDFLLRLQ